MKKILVIIFILLLAKLGLAQDIPLTQILVFNESWKKSTGTDLGGTFSALASDSNGALFLASPSAKSILKLDSTGKLSTVVNEAPSKAIASDFLGGLFLASSSENKLMYAPKGSTKAEVIVSGIDCVALTGLKSGNCYGAVPDEKAIYFIQKSGIKSKVFSDDAVISLTTTNDETTLFAGSADGKSVYTFRIEQNGELSAKDRYVAPQKPTLGTKGSVPGLAVDKVNRIYAATSLGVQAFDPTGRLCGVFLQPDFPNFAGTIAFAGEDRSILYALVGTTLYTRKILFPTK